MVLKPVLLSLLMVLVSSENIILTKNGDTRFYRMTAQSNGKFGLDVGYSEVKSPPYTEKVILYLDNGTDVCSFYMNLQYIHITDGSDIYLVDADHGNAYPVNKTTIVPVTYDGTTFQVSTDDKAEKCELEWAQFNSTTYILDVVVETTFEKLINEAEWNSRFTLTMNNGIKFEDVAAPEVDEPITTPSLNNDSVSNHPDEPLASSASFGATVIIPVGIGAFILGAVIGFIGVGTYLYMKKKNDKRQSSGQNTEAADPKATTGARTTGYFEVPKRGRGIEEDDANSPPAADPVKTSSKKGTKRSKKGVL